MVQSIYWWANDGDWTRAWWIHNPLPWSTWLHPPLPPHWFKSLSTIRSFLSYSRYQREAFSYTIVASLLLCFGIRGNKASTSRSFLAKLQRLGCSLHWFDFTLLKIKERGRAGSEGSFSRQRASSKHSTYSYQNEKRASIRESHCALASCIGFQTCAPLNYKLWSSYFDWIYGIFKEAPFYKPFHNIREARRAFFACLSAPPFH